MLSNTRLCRPTKIVSRQCTFRALLYLAHWSMLPPLLLRAPTAGKLSTAICSFVCVVVFVVLLLLLHVLCGKLLVDQLFLRLIFFSHYFKKIIFISVFNSQEKQKYTILLIITDGMINDLEATKVLFFLLYLLGVFDTVVTMHRLSAIRKFALLQIFIFD